MANHVVLGDVNTWYDEAGTGEPLVEKPELCNDLIVQFLTTDPVRLIAPIRRRAAKQ